MHGQFNDLNRFQNGEVNTWQMSNPIFTGTLENDLFLVDRDVVHGTSFSIGNDLMVTAGHVIRNLEISGKDFAVGVSSPKGDELKAAEVVEVEKLDCDVGIMKIRFLDGESPNWIFSNKWSEHSRGTFDIVRTLGFPYGLQRIGDKTALMHRGFEGHIVSSPFEYLPEYLADYRGPAFATYELSFKVDRGLSGAPLFTGRGSLVVVGMMLANSATAMITSSEIVENEKGKETVYEVLHLGVAIQSKEILILESSMLGMSIGNYLSKNDLIVR
jgi:hypothetical protein